MSKINETELQELQSLQLSWDGYTKAYGEAYYQLMLQKEQLEHIEKKLWEIEHNRRKIMVELEKKLGTTGTINLKTGEFVPDNK